MRKKKRDSTAFRRENTPAMGRIPRRWNETRVFLLQVPEGEKGVYLQDPKTPQGKDVQPNWRKKNHSVRNTACFGRSMEKKETHKPELS